jgi:hypothetical protein
MNGRDQHEWVASALSVAKLPYDQALDGISLTSNPAPTALGKTPKEQVENLTGILDGFFTATCFHVNVNVLDRDTLLDAMEHPGQLRAADHPGFRVRGELSTSDQGAAARRRPPDLPRLALTLMSVLQRLSIAPVRKHHGGSRADLETELAEEGDPEIGYYHSYEITGAVNGPGVRFTLFLSKCPLRCQYCENPGEWEGRY